MQDLLSYLENLTYPEDLPPEYFKATKCQEPYLNAIQKRLSMDFLDGFINSQCEEVHWTRREAFSRGFRLGAQIILALAEPSAPGTRHRP